MRRREFITLFAGAAVVWPLAARAQQQRFRWSGFFTVPPPIHLDLNWPRFAKA